MPMTRRNSTRKSGFVVLWGKSEADSDYDKKADLREGSGVREFCDLSCAPFHQGFSLFSTIKYKFAGEWG